MTVWVSHSCSSRSISFLFTHRVIPSTRLEARLASGKSARALPARRCAKDRVYNIVLYQVALSCIIGAIIGYIARKTLRFAESRK